MASVKLKEITGKHRGISSIIGAIFFLVLMVTGFSVYFLALDSQVRMIDVQQIIADLEIKKIQEKFSVATSINQSDSNRLEIQVDNEGNNAVEIAGIWIVNRTDTNQPATRYELNYTDTHIPVGFSGDILENTPLYMVDDVYDIKVVSTLGTIVNTELDVLGLGGNSEAQIKYVRLNDDSYGNAVGWDPNPELLGYTILDTDVSYDSLIIASVEREPPSWPTMSFSTDASCNQIIVLEGQFAINDCYTFQQGSVLRYAVINPAS